METSQGNQCIAILNKQICHFVFYKSGEEEGNTGVVWRLVQVGYNWGDVGRGCRRVNKVQILCTHVCKWENDIC
jgi:hypothetical protein